jgi:hypothetical protein
MTRQKWSLMATALPFLGFLSPRSESLDGDDWFIRGRIKGVLKQAAAVLIVSLASQRRPSS